MTPRQLLALTEQHSVYTSRDQGDASAPARPAPRRPQTVYMGRPAEHGSAGWLLAMAQQAGRSAGPSSQPVG